MVTVRIESLRLVSTEGISVHLPLAEPGDLVAQGFFERVARGHEYAHGLLEGGQSWPQPAFSRLGPPERRLRA
jgi:hypothetical protein